MGIFFKTTTKLSPVIHPVFTAQFSGGTCNVSSTWRKKSQETLDCNIHPQTTKQTRVQVKTSFIELFILFVLLINCFGHCRHTLQSCCCCFFFIKGTRLTTPHTAANSLAGTVKHQQVKKTAQPQIAFTSSVKAEGKRTGSTTTTS